MVLITIITLEQFLTAPFRKEQKLKKYQNASQFPHKNHNFRWSYPEVFSVKLLCFFYIYLFFNLREWWSGKGKFNGPSSFVSKDFHRTCFNSSTGHTSIYTYHLVGLNINLLHIFFKMWSIPNSEHTLVLSASDFFLHTQFDVVSTIETILDVISSWNRDNTASASQHQAFRWALDIHWGKNMSSKCLKCCFLSNRHDTQSSFSLSQTRQATFINKSSLFFNNKKIIEANETGNIGLAALNKSSSFLLTSEIQVTSCIYHYAYLIHVCFPGKYDAAKGERKNKAAATAMQA